MSIADCLYFHKIKTMSNDAGLYLEGWIGKYCTNKFEIDIISLRFRMYCWTIPGDFFSRKGHFLSDFYHMQDGIKGTPSIYVIFFQKSLNDGNSHFQFVVFVITQRKSTLLILHWRIM